MGNLKDRIDRASNQRLAAAIVAADPDFPGEQFVRAATRGLGPLELKARVAHVAAVLDECLGGDFVRAADVVDRAMAASTLTGLDAWPVLAWVEFAGRAHPEVAVSLLGRLTASASAEFAIRPFIDDDPGHLWPVLERWTSSDDEHVRRLVSEGTRPLLPWAPRLAVATADPGWAVELLDRLVDDPSEYVRRSVANHLNDLCKLDLPLARTVAGRWSARGATAVVRHGVRTLVKAGDPDVLRLVGFDPDVDVIAESLRVEPQSVAFGGEVEVRVTLRTTSGPAVVMVDYGVHLLRANGRHGRKVYKVRATTIDQAGLDLVWRHSFRAVTVRRYYPGMQRIDVQVNGRVLAEVEFELLSD